MFPLDTSRQGPRVVQRREDASTEEDSVLVIVALVVVAAVAAAVAWSVVNGESWEERARPEPEEAAPATDAGEATPPQAEIEPSPAGSLGVLTRRQESVAPVHRRVRFEDALDLTIPLGLPQGDVELDGDLASVGANGYGPAPAEPIEERVPMATRVSGALRLMLLVAVAAGLVALAVVGTGYLLSERVVDNLGR
jgi:hypothetical protein